MTGDPPPGCQAARYGPSGWNAERFLAPVRDAIAAPLEVVVVEECCCCFWLVVFFMPLGEDEICYQNRIAARETQTPSFIAMTKNVLF